MGDVMVITGAEEAKAAVGKHLGYSDWLEITQERVEPVRRGDGRPPVDPRRPGAGQGRPLRRHHRPRLPHAVAVELLPARRSSRYEGISLAVNYGVDKVRFPSAGAGRLAHPRRRRADRRSPRSPAASRPRCSSPSRSRAGAARLRHRVALPVDVMSEMTATEGGAADQMGSGVKQRDQIKMSDEEIDEFLDGKHTISFATMNRDGTIHMVAMWYGFLEGEIAFETKAKSQKVQNLRRNPTITCMVEDGDTYNELRGVQIVGTAEIVEDPDRMLEMGRSACSSATSVLTPRRCTRRSR